MNHRFKDRKIIKLYQFLKIDVEKTTYQDY